jgi:hypothetical protein
LVQDDGSAVSVNGDFKLGTNGTTNTTMIVGSYSVNPPNLGGGNEGTYDVTVNNAIAGARVFCTPPNGLENGLIYKSAEVTANNTVTIKFRNVTGGNINGGIQNWSIMVINP